MAVARSAAAASSDCGRGSAREREEEVSSRAPRHRRVELDEGALLRAGKLVFHGYEQRAGLVGGILLLRRAEEVAERGAELGG